MEERLQKILSSRGVASRRKAEEMIRSGLVRVNGAVAKLGDSANPERDEILVEGKAIPAPPEYVYIMLHKPRGYVTTLSDEKGRDNAAQLVADCGTRVYPIGRLDMDSEGLLLFTNDGELANSMMHPSREVEKEYEVKVRGFEPGKEILLARPIELDGYRIRKPEVKLVEESGGRANFRVIIHEGRNRQIRRMCEAAGMQVIKLKRIREGKLLLGKLAPGKWRYLTEEEVQNLKK